MSSSNRCIALFFSVSAFLTAPVIRAAPEDPERQTVLVLDFTSQLGADPQLAELFASMVISELVETARFEVIARRDVETMLETEEERQLLGCNSTSCIAEIGGALGAQLLVRGDLSLLGEKHMLTLKLLDTREAKLVNQLSEPLPGAREQFDLVARRATYELVGLQLEAMSPWYQSPWVLGGAAVAVLAVAAASYVLLSSGNDVSQRDGGLGKVTLDE